MTKLSNTILLALSPLAVYTWDLKQMGGLGPFVARDDGISPDSTPDGCKVDQVILYSRHGERYPDTPDYDRMKKTVDKLKDGDLDGPLEFLKDYEFFMSKDDSGQLTTDESNKYAGKPQLQTFGKQLHEKYGALARGVSKLNIFATDMSRVYKSAVYFAQGFFGGDWEAKSNILQLKESGDPMNSLTPEVSCRQRFQGEHDPSGDYKSKAYGTIVDRLKKHTSQEIDTSDIDNLMMMCPYELNANGKSDFCDLFEGDEWDKFEYSRSLHMYYDYPVYPKASVAAGSVLTNASLTLMKDGPKKVGGLFFEFTHDAVLLEVYSALGLFLPDEKLPGDEEPHNNPFKISQITPMLGHIILERMSCGDGKYVRVKVNDAVTSFHDCTDGPGKSCSLENYEDILDGRFVSFQDYCGLKDGDSRYTDVFWKNKNVANS